MSDTWVLSFTHLKDRPKAQQALHFLQRVASLVKPIMRKHGWKLPVLSEFFPDSDNLVGLNVNRGQKILLRLRPAWAPDTFYDEEDVIHTMLHELTHNVHGPHDAAFYKYLSGLEEEYEALKRSGWAGEGFFSAGTRLGTGVSHNLSPHDARLKAIDAAEKRRRIGGMMSGSRRLGGSRPTSNLTPRELAAQAAERRAQDEKACGQSIGRDAEREADKAAQQGVLTQAPIIDLTSDDDDDVIIVDDPTSNAGPSKVAIPISAEKAAATAVQPTLSRPDDSQARRLKSPALTDLKAKPSRYLNTAASEWACLACTLLNPHATSICAACGSSQPSSLATADRTMGPHGTGWTCAQCTLINPGTATTCEACDEPAPMSLTPTTTTISMQGSEWICLSCGADGNPRNFWSCRLCGSIKTSS